MNNLKAAGLSEQTITEVASQFGVSPDKLTFGPLQKNGWVKVYVNKRFSGIRVYVTYTRLA